MIMLSLTNQEADQLKGALAFVLDCEPPDPEMEQAVRDILQRLTYETSVLARLTGPLKGDE